MHFLERFGEITLGNAVVEGATIGDFSKCLT